MPSGPKKRKAARRKKEKENNNINHSYITNNPVQGNDDLKSHDEKGSDGRETNSLAYREHGDHRDPLKDGSEAIGERDPPAAQPIASDGENERLEHVETAKESCYKSGNGGGNSNDESLAEKNSKDEIYNSVKTVASVSEVEKCDTGVAPLQESVDLVGKMNEDSVYPLTYVNDTTSNLEEPRIKESNIEVFTNGVEHTKDSETRKYSKNQSSVSSVPNSVKKTSWWSCCGLLEVLSGSTR